MSMGEAVREREREGEMGYCQLAEEAETRRTRRTDRARKRVRTWGLNSRGNKCQTEVRKKRVNCPWTL